MRKLIALLCLAPAMAWGQVAEPITSGDLVTSDTVLCNTSAQIEHILQTDAKDGVVAANLVIRQYNNVVGEDGEPTCGVGLYSFKVIEQVASVENVHHGASLRTFYVVKIELGDGKQYHVALMRPVQLAGSDA